MDQKTMAKLLGLLRKEAMSKGKFDIRREGFFRGVLKASFIRSFELVSLLHKRKIEQADEGGRVARPFSGWAH